MHIVGDSYLRTGTRASASLNCAATPSDEPEEMAALREHFFEPQLLNLIDLPRRERAPSPMALEPLCDSDSVYHSWINAHMTTICDAVRDP